MEMSARTVDSASYLLCLLCVCVRGCVEFLFWWLEVYSCQERGRTTLILPSSTVELRLDRHLLKLCLILVKCLVGMFIFLSFSR